MELNNPLRPQKRVIASQQPAPVSQSTVTPEKKTEAPLSQAPKEIEIPNLNVMTSETPVLSHKDPIMQTIPTPAPTAHKEREQVKMVRDSLRYSLKQETKTQATVSNDPALKAALELIAKSGLEVSAPKTKYVKHSYEIEESLHKEFHSMYPVLGHKFVKQAINEAIKLWCDKNRSEFNRRKG